MSRTTKFARSSLVLNLLLVAAAGAEQHSHEHDSHAAMPYLIEPGPVETSVLYADDRVVEVGTETVTWPICGSDPSAITVQDLIEISAAAQANFAPGAPTWQISAEPVRGGLNIVFNVSGGLPAGAQAAIDATALYIESQFADPITVTVNMSMASMSPGVLGATSSSFIMGTSWTTTRSGLVSGMDADDTIQSFLPSGSTIPVRYNASTSTVSNESQIRFTRANYNATIGSSAGSAATMTLNTNFSWDYDPTNGITVGRYCFQSVLVHEVGHALGFISRVDSGAGMDALDIYRFQRTDGAGTDWNPDDLVEFGTTARTVDFNNLNDDANSDIITAEYAMSDGDPWQASHFREQGSNIGIMDPSMGFNTTFYPNFFRDSDLNMFDAIGWDRVVCAPIIFDTQPRSQDAIDGDLVSFSVVVSGTGPFSYQWRKNGVNLSDGPAAGGGTISGSTTPSLSIDPVGEADSGEYDCVAASGCGSDTSDPANLSVCAPVVLEDQPDSAVVNAGDRVSFSVVTSGTGPFSYRWRHNGINLADGPAPGGGVISGAATDTISIDPVGLADAGDYQCIVGNLCGSEPSDIATLTVNAGVPGATVIGAVSRKGCDLPAGFNGGAVTSDSRQGGVTELRIAFDVSPGGPGPSPVAVQQATCAAPAYAPYAGAAAVSASLAGNELVVTFTPGLENGQTYRVNMGADVTSIAGQYVEIRGLIGDVSGNGTVDATDRSLVVGAWTGAGFTCASDVNNDAITNATDRSLVVGAWTGSQNCAP